MSKYRYIWAVLSSLFALTLYGQDKADEGEQKQAAVEVTKAAAEKAPIFGGAAIFVDLVGPIMKAFSSNSSNMEVGARINFCEKYFPVGEVGLGTSHREGTDNGNLYRVTAPYFRVGFDYNFNKKVNGNRLFAGARYGLSSFNMDFTNDQFTDPVFNNNRPLEVLGQTSTCHWLELVGCVETKLWSIIRLGFTFRFKFMISMSGDEYGEPYFIPGFGRNGQPFGGTFYVAFDVGKSARSAKKSKAAAALPLKKD